MTTAIRPRSWRPPRYLQDRAGRPLKVPRKAARVLRCRERACAAPGERRRHFWACCARLHGRLYPDAELLRQLLAAWPLALPEKSLNAPRRVLRHVYRLLALEADRDC